MTAEVTPELVRQLLDVSGEGTITRLTRHSLAAAYLQVCEERDRLRDRANAVFNLHASTYVERLGGVCYECGGRAWPCPTNEALGGSDV